jgi:hypothetical protein
MPIGVDAIQGTEKVPWLYISRIVGDTPYKRIPRADDFVPFERGQEGREGNSDLGRHGNSIALLENRDI